MSVLQYAGLGIAALLAAAAPLPAPTDGFNILDSLPKPNDLPKFAEPLKLFTASAPSYYSGSYRHRVPIAVPPSRTGLTPEIALEYDSNGEDGPLGKGWSLTSDRIFRTLRHGTPRYLGPAGQSGEDELEYDVGGERGVLVFVRSTATGLLYRPRSERGLFAKFYYESSEDQWIVRTRDGLTRTFGGQPARDASGSETYAWNIATATNTDGDSIAYTWTSDSGALYLTRIAYDLRALAPHPYPPRVEFDWKSVPSTFHKASYRKGWRTVLNGRELQAITTMASDESGKGQSRRYEVRYDLPYSDPARALAEIVPQDLPFTRFTYNSPPKAFTGYRYMPDPDTAGAFPEQTSLRHTKVTASLKRTISMLADVDGDGKLDLIYVRSHHDHPGVVSGNQWYWRQNLDQQWGPERPIPLPSACASEPADAYGCHPDALTWENRLYPKWLKRYQTLIDMNGDGAVDLVFVQRTSTNTGVLFEIVVYLATGIPNSVTFGPGKIYYSEVQPGSGVDLALYSNRSESFFSRYGPLSVTWDAADLIDMNGDGIPDLVRAAGPTTLAVRLLDGTGNYRPVDMSVPACNDETWGDPFGCIRSSAAFASASWDRRTLIDMNGDRLPDLMIFKDEIQPAALQIPSSPHSVQVYYGTGRGFDFNQPQDVTVMNQPFNTALSEPDGGPTAQVSGYYDLNGDGYPDFVSWGSLAHGFYDLETGEMYSDVGWWGADGSWRWNRAPKPALNVFLNDASASSFRLGYQWELCPRCQSLPLATMGMSGLWREAWKMVPYDIELRQAFLDFDGDGQVELVSVANTGNDTPFIIYKVFNSQPPRKLSRVETGSGWQTDITYGHPQQSASRVPLPLWPVSSITVTDKITGRYRIDRIESVNPKIDPASGEFFGYQKVDVSDEEKRVSHLYLQDAYSGGLEFLTETYKNPGREADLRKRVRTDYDWLSTGDVPQDVRRWWRPRSVTTSVFDEGRSAYSTVEQFEYNDGGFQGCDGGSGGRTLGLIRARVAGLANSPERREVFSYDCVDSDARYLVRTSATRETDIAGTVEARTTWRYDDQCSWSPAPLTKGKVCETRTYRGQDPSGNDLPEAVTRTQYDQLGRVSGMTAPDGEVTYYDYWDVTGLLKKETKAGPGVSLTRFYSQYHPHSGTPGRTCGPQFVTNAETDKCETTTYDLWGRPKEVLSPLDDGTGGFKPAKVRTYDYVDSYKGGAAPQLPSFTTTEFPDPLNALPGVNPPRQTLTYFDGWGNAIQEVGSASAGYVRNFFEYDPQNRLSRVWWQTASEGAGFEPLKGQADFSYGYDVLGRAISVINATGLKQTASYRGGRIDVRDEAGNVTVFETNAFGQVTGRTRRAGTADLKRTFVYDAAGRLFQATDEDNAVYKYVYYKDGALRSSTLPTASHVYDRTPGGKILSVSRADGGLVSFEYDGLGRIAWRRVRPGKGTCAAPAVDDQKFSYDAIPSQTGYLAEVTGSHFRLRFEYDAFGRVRSKSLEDLQAGRKLFYEKKYNALGENVEVHYPTGRVLTRFYDPRGLLTKISDSTGVLSASEFVYDPDRLLRSYKGSVKGASGSRLEFSRRFDYSPQPYGTGQRRLESIALEAGPAGAAATVHNTTYTYWDNNLVKTISDPSRTLNRSFQYDGASRLVSAWGYPGGAGQQFDYRYNANGSIAGVTFGSQDTAFVRTNQNQAIQSRTTTNTAPPLSVLGESTAYSVSAATGDLCDSALQIWTVTNYKREFRWSGDDTLASVRQTASKNDFFTAYEYDHVGTRWRRERDGQAAIYLDDVAELPAAGPSIDYVLLPHARCALPADGAGVCYFSDRTDVAYVYGDDGKLRQTRSYQPYGEAVTKGSPLPVEFGYLGHRVEPESGLLHFGARYYDPNASQFLSVDPSRIGRMDDAPAKLNTLQPYVLSASNPTTYIDANGADPAVQNYYISASTGNPSDVFTGWNYGASAGSGFWAQAGAGLLKLPNSIVNLGCWAANVLIGANREAEATFPEAMAIIPEARMLSAGVGALRAAATLGATSGTARGGMTVWNAIRATQAAYPGTVIPKSFELAAAGRTFWVHPNATKHMAEYVGRFLSFGNDMAGQAMLKSFEAAVKAAIAQGIQYNTMIRIGGWELMFGLPARPGLLPVIYHALMQ